MFKILAYGHIFVCLKTYDEVAGLTDTLLFPSAAYVQPQLAYYR